MIELFTIIGTLSVLINLCLLLYLSIGIICTRTELTDEQPFVSVIVAAHNESQNIENCINSLLNQNYPHNKMEIIAVNDRSEDNTGLILDEYSENNKRVQVLNISKCKVGLSPKKNALIQALIKRLYQGIKNFVGPLNLLF